MADDLIPMQDDDTVHESDTVHGQDNAAQPGPANEPPSAPVESPVTDLIPQPGGGALRPPWPKGHGPGKGVSAKGVSIRALRNECRELMATNAVGNVKKLQERIDSEDERVSIIALQEWFKLFWGKESPAFVTDDAERKMDFSHLSHEKQIEAAALITRLRELLSDVPD